jgi:hypothetical protein
MKRLDGALCQLPTYTQSNEYIDVFPFLLLIGWLHVT